MWWRVRGDLARQLGRLSVLPPAPAVPAALHHAPHATSPPVPPPPAASIEFFHRHHFTLPAFTPALSREFAPYKVGPAQRGQGGGARGHTSPQGVLQRRPARSPALMQRSLALAQRCSAAMLHERGWEAAAHCAGRARHPTCAQPLPAPAPPCPQPNPASLLHIAEKWGVAPSELVMVGDSAKDDVSAACGCTALPSCSAWHQADLGAGQGGARAKGSTACAVSRPPSRGAMTGRGVGSSTGTGLCLPWQRQEGPACG